MLQAFVKWVQALGYRTTIPNHLQLDQLLQLMKTDKKAVTNSATFVLLEAVGSPLLIGNERSRVIERNGEFYRKVMEGQSKVIRGIRGATTVEHDTETEVLAAVDELMTEMIAANKIEPDDGCFCIFFSNR